MSRPRFPDNDTCQTQFQSGHRLGKTRGLSHGFYCFDSSTSTWQLDVLVPGYIIGYFINEVTGSHTCQCPQIWTQVENRHAGHVIGTTLRATVSDIGTIRVVLRILKQYRKIGQAGTGIIWLSDSQQDESATTFKFFQELYSHVDIKPVVKGVHCLHPENSANAQPGSCSLVSNVYSYMPPDRPANLNDILAGMKEWARCAAVQRAFEDLAHRTHKGEK
ncbi:hypothetical protein C8J56DRAFT_1081549 [Mycena floridula]|nr:hypothetical protein C8J56DRAFT_1081549 [Mycena floridula]